MECGVREELKLVHTSCILSSSGGLNGVWSPRGIETVEVIEFLRHRGGLNGVWSPRGIETPMGFLYCVPLSESKWSVESERN